MSFTKQLLSKQTINCTSSWFRNPKYPNPFVLSGKNNRFTHSDQENDVTHSDQENDVTDSDQENDVNGFSDDTYPCCDDVAVDFAKKNSSSLIGMMHAKLSKSLMDMYKQRMDWLSMVIAEKVLLEMKKNVTEEMSNSTGPGASSQALSEDELWKTLQVSNAVLKDINRTKVERIRTFPTFEDVKELCNAAVKSTGVQGKILKEMVFEWAYQKNEQLTYFVPSSKCGEIKSKETFINASEPGNMNAYPKRSDLDPKCAEMTGKVHETDVTCGVITPHEPKAMNEKCMGFADEILLWHGEPNLSLMLANWIKLLQPTRIDHLALLDILKEQNTQLYFKVAELLLDEESFETSIRDYVKLVDDHVKKNNLEDAMRVLKKMNGKGVFPSVLSFMTMAEMYSKGGNLDHAKEAFDHVKEKFQSLRSQSFQQDIKHF